MTSILSDKKRYDCSALPKGWQKEEVLRKTGLMAGKVDVYYHSPYGDKFSTKAQLARCLGDVIDLATFDFNTGKINSLLLQKFKKQRGTQFDYSRGVRNDASFVPPIRQTASIFKKPVTVHRNFPVEEGSVPKPVDLKHGNQEKPKQLFWEKRLENLSACDVDGFEVSKIKLPKPLSTVGPNVSEQTVIRSIATVLHVSTQPVTGQTVSKVALEKNPGVFLNPEQPLVHVNNISDDDIKYQEQQVQMARQKLQEAIAAAEEM